MRFWFTVILMLVLVGSAHRFGRGPERSAANLLGGNLVLSMINLAIGGSPTFQNVNTGLASIDALTFVGLTWVALRANRMWPLIIAALQLLVIFAHASVLISVGWNMVYYGMMALSQYFELIVLTAGIASHAMRERRIGRYRDWRSGHVPTLFESASLNSARAGSSAPPDMPDAVGGNGNLNVARIISPFAGEMRRDRPSIEQNAPGYAAPTLVRIDRLCPQRAPAVCVTPDRLAADCSLAERSLANPQRPGVRASQSPVRDRSTVR